MDNAGKAQIERVKKKRRKRWLQIVIITLGVLLFASGGYAYYLYSSVESAAKKMYSPLKKEKSDLRNEKVSVEKKQPVSILIMGVDERENDRGRSDSMVLLSVNPNNNSILMLSIPRDSRTEIVGKGKEDKINHAYAYGGVEMTINTVEKFLNIPIDYYAEINMEGFAQIVDTLGGVDVTNKFSFNYEGYSFPEGNLHLNGVKALKYSRMRYDDPRGDFGRAERQRQVLKAIIQKASTPAVLTKLGEILQSLGDNVRTNLTFEEMQTMSTSYRQAARNIRQEEIKGRGTKINGVYYYIVPQEERNRLNALIKQQLELK